jgi:hypothetical protein
MARGLQNSPAGIAVALDSQADLVELDVRCGRDGAFLCCHGTSAPSTLADCLAQLRAPSGLIAHLKGRFDPPDLLRLWQQLQQQLAPEGIIIASHRGAVLRRAAETIPLAARARFGWLPAVLALVRPQPWDICMVNQVLLSTAHVRALQRRGFRVFASCVWELRSRSSVARLGVDAAFVNLH